VQVEFAGSEQQASAARSIIHGHERGDADGMQAGL